jgi:FkbM family methyltransferase
VTQNPIRIAVISTVVPPGAQGQAHVLSQLIGFPPPDNCLFLADQPPFPPGTPLVGDFANYRILQPVRTMFRAGGWLENRAPRLNFLLGALCSLVRRIQEISRHVRAFNATALVACTASPFDLPACALVALRWRMPLVTYLFDDPIFQWPPGPLRKFARLCEPLWSRIAAQVIVPNEAMASKFSERRRCRRPVIVRNAVSPEAIPSANAWPVVPGQFRIVYTGSVYHAQSDAFSTLLIALKNLHNWSLHIYTSQSEAELAAIGLHGDNVFHHQHVGQSEAYRQQRFADVLFLPLAFHSTISEVLRTSAPMKMGEYLASGRPILVHAPKDTFIVELFRRHHAGVVVDVPSADPLADALTSIERDPELRQSICEHAIALSDDYRVDKAASAFWTAIKLAIQDHPTTPRRSVAPTNVSRLRGVPTTNSSKRSSARIPPMKHLIGRLTFAAIWAPTILHCKTARFYRATSLQLAPTLNRIRRHRIYVRLRGWSNFHRSRKLKLPVRRSLKRTLTLIPPIRNYLAEKYILQDSWDRAAAERDVLAAECTRLNEIQTQQQISMRGLSVEFDRLKEISSQQQLVVDSLYKERDSSLGAQAELRSKTDKLENEIKRAHDTIEQAHTHIEDVAADFSTRDKRAQDQLASAHDRIQELVSQLQVERNLGEELKQAVTQTEDIVSALRREAAELSDELKRHRRPRWIDIPYGTLKGRKILLDPQTPVCDVLLQQEPIFEALEEYGLEGKVVWDVGAYIGYHALAFAVRVGRTGHVITFEPNPYNVARVTQNLNKNSDLRSRITLITDALSDRDGTDSFRFSSGVDTGESSGSHLCRVLPPEKQSVYGSFSEMTVNTARADTLVAKKTVPLPTIMKIDVEGAEGLVLSGAVNLLETARPILLIEIHHTIGMFHVQGLLNRLQYEMRILKTEEGPQFRCQALALPASELSQRKSARSIAPVTPAIVA